LEKLQFKLGDPCFIVSDEAGHMCIMPGQVVHISGTPKPHYGGMAMHSARLGRAISAEGTAYATAKEARAHARAQLRKRERTTLGALGARLARIPLIGYRPNWDIPTSMPRWGEAVYVHDEEAGEVLEVTVGFIGLTFASFEAAYDPSPGNGEVSMVPMRHWWANKETAFNAARYHLYREFTFVPKEEVARRADAAIEKIWSDPEERLRDPEWNRRHNEGLRAFIKAVQDRVPVAAG